MARKSTTKLLPPKQAQIVKQMAKFLQILAINGIVADALKASGLNRQTAYTRLDSDKEFAAGWYNALEEAEDKLRKEAVRRGKDGFLRPIYQNGKKVGSVREYSDTLLIYTMNYNERQKKWRKRIVQAGQLALDVVHKEGERLGLSMEQIAAIQTKMTESFSKISLI